MESADISPTPARKELTQEEIITGWKLAAPHRKDICMEVIKGIREIINADVVATKYKFSQALQLVHDKFNLYHLGIYVVQGDWLVLYAGAGEAIDRMLARGEKRVIRPEYGLTGHVAATQKIRCAWDVSPDTRFYFQGPDLGETKSEIALPLLRNNRTIGVIDLQSLIRCDFREEEYEAFQMMADCVAEFLEMQLR
jgi:putative methionine-R-sulfoxide reductase with GAF domain